ncbi:MAG: M23 family metallopeptidase [Deltaproteobacteria bacterium]
MESKGSLSFLVIPSSPHKRPFSISVPFLIVPAFFVAFLAILFVACAGAWRTYSLHQAEAKSHFLETENRSATARIEAQEAKIVTLTQEISKIREKAAYIQTHLGLKAEGSGHSTRAQGGIELTPQKASKSSRISPPINPHQHTAAPGAKAGPVSLEEIGQLDADLKEIIDVLHRRQEKLDHTPSASPVDPRESWISSSYGLRISPFEGKEQFHPGLDIAGAERTPIITPAKGSVAFVGRDGSLGMAVRIRHDSVYESTFGHLSKAAVKKGQRVDRGDVIGFMGNSGRSTGPHLHYEIAKNGKSVNPLPYMTDWRGSPPVLAKE